MKALIVGLGSIGERHLNNLRMLVPHADITVWRQNTPPSRDGFRHQNANRIVYSVTDALDVKPDIAIITNPAAMHIMTGLKLAHEGTSLFIEKPFSNNLDGIEELIQLCHSHEQTLMIGYNLRFLSSLQLLKETIEEGVIGKTLSIIAEVGQYLPDWRPGIKYSKSVSAQNQLGGGALLELSHELDYTRWLMGEVQTVSAQTGKLSDLEMDVEDIADIHLQFTNGAFGSIHLDMLQRTPSRTCKLIGTNGTLVWDGVLNSVRLYSAETQTWQDVFPAQALDRNEIYILELKHFIDCVENGTNPLITGEDGLQALKIALAAKESALSHKVIDLQLLFQGN
jgi:predicted dehydrogenase